MSELSLEIFENFVDGVVASSTSGEHTVLVDPVTGSPYAKAVKSNQSDIDEAMRAAKAAFTLWKNTTPGARQLALLKIADAIEAKGDELADIEVKNTGKPKELFLSEELTAGIDQIRFFAGAARMLEGKGAGEYMEGFTSYIRREPVGVCAQVTPWNYPWLMAVWKWAPAIAAGNTVVLKPSDTTPASTVWTAKLCSEFLPKGVFNVICGERETGQWLMEHPIPAMNCITGSVRAGIAVAETAAKKLTKCHLELGGKAPVVVFDDVENLAEAVNSISEAAYFNAGQDCTAATRILVQEHIYDDFVARFVAVAKDLTAALGTDKALFGPLNNVNQWNRVKEMVLNTPAHAKIQCGGKALDRSGYYYEATVITDLKQDDTLIQEEIFGPVVTIQKFASEADAIMMANDVKYGLASSVFSGNLSRQMRCARDLEFGCVWQNCHIPLVAEMPHGGFKQSGYGKDLSGYGFEDYTRVKHVMASIGGA